MRFLNVGAVAPAIVVVAFMAGCGGGGSDGGSTNPPISSSDPSSSAGSSSSATSSSVASSLSSSISSTVSTSSSSSSSSASSLCSPDGESVTISGTVTYDYVPLTTSGLDFESTESRPVRLAAVELVDDSGTVLCRGATDIQGDYVLTAPAETPVAVTVLSRTEGDVPSIRVEDNTNSDRLYALSGQTVTSGSSDSIRDLHAPSGWNGSAYDSAEARAAAPYALMDTGLSVYEYLSQIDPGLDFGQAFIRWSPDNTATEGNVADGHITTSSYRNGALYILGDEGADTDEFDRHVVVHELGHYVDDVFDGRLDSIGGPHGLEDKLDMRVAFSEGYANAFSGTVLDDPVYLDSREPESTVVGGFRIDDKQIDGAGWYNEASVQAILYHLAQTEGYGPIHRVMISNAFAQARSLHSLFTFAAFFRDQEPAASTTLDDLLAEQSVAITDQYGTDETNDGNTETALPLYRELPTDGSVINVCSSQENGTDNKLGVYANLYADVPQTGTYRIEATRTSPTDREKTDPDFWVINRGGYLAFGSSEDADTEAVSAQLNAGRRYIIPLYDFETHDDPQATGYKPSCFDVSMSLEGN